MSFSGTSQGVIIAPQTGQFVNRAPLFAVQGTRGFGIWLFATLMFTLVPYLVLLWSVAPHSNYIVQDDARHFVVWFRRMIDPELYAHDISADFFAAITPWLYRALYWPFTFFQVDPLQAHLYFVMPLTGLLLAFAIYIFVYHFWPSPIGAAVATLVLINILGWRNGLPHDFGYTLVLLVTLAFVSRRVFASAAAIFAATGLLPASALVSGLTTGILMLSPRAPFVSRNPRDWAVLVAIGIAFLVGAYVAVSSVEKTGPTFTASEARSIPFMGSQDGFRSFWGPSFVSSYVCNENLGIVPFCGDEGIDTLEILDGVSDTQKLMWTILVVAVISITLWLVGSGRIGRWMSAVGLPPIEHQLALVWTAWIISGTILFAIAHVIAFELHMPSRFSRYTITLTLGMIAALAIAVLFLRLLLACLRPGKLRRALATGLLVLSACGLLWVSVRYLSDNAAFRWSDAPSIEAYLRKTPKNTLVAGVLREIDSVPAFGDRSVLSSLELTAPLKKIYFHEMATRTTALAKALYASDRSAFAELLARYSIDYVVVERVPKEEPARLSELANNFPAILDTARALYDGRQPFFRARIDQCARAEDGNLVLADANCVVSAP